MTKILSITKSLIPRSIKRWKLVRALGSKLPHSFVYDAKYYEEAIEGPAAFSSKEMARLIARWNEPKSVLDVGCGTGALMEALTKLGCKTTGLEYSENGLKFCRERGLDVTRFDLESDSLEESQSFDVVVSMEVAEHLPEISADRYIKLLTGSGDQVVFTAAPPGQGGKDHVNEQPADYWIEKFAKEGFEYLPNETAAWKEEWKESGQVKSWYYTNLLLLRRKAH